MSTDKTKFIEVKTVLLGLWDFVETYLPDYSSNDDIAYHDDLIKIQVDEWVENDAAHTKLVDDYDGLRDNPQIQIDINEVEAKLFRAAIEGYVNRVNHDNQ